MEECNECENGIIDEICGTCNGSGEGAWDESTCAICGGSGSEKSYCDCEMGEKRLRKEVF